MQVRFIAECIHLARGTQKMPPAYINIERINPTNIRYPNIFDKQDCQTESVQRNRKISS